MNHLLNICNINGAEIEPVDIITFGSPCQDLSVAGKRAGIQDGKRSNLFFEAIRIIKEMRKVTNGEYPKYAVWENVPGAFSSNKGHDFHAVLEALCSICGNTLPIPRPYDPKRPDRLCWRTAGEIVGDNYSIAWRVLDAQYWGVPQRRKRIYLVADFTGRCAGEILFKPDSLRGDFTQGDETGQGATADAVGGFDGSVRDECIVDALPFNTTQITSPQNGNNPKWGDPCHCLASTDHPPAAVNALQANGIDRTIPINDKATRHNGGGDTRRNDGAGNGLGIGKENDPSPTVTAADRHAVCYDARGNGDGETAATVRTACGGDSVKANLAVRETLCFDETQITSPANGNNPQWNEPSHPLASTARPPTVICKQPPRRYIIRRLTPTECARLQGFPDKWGHPAPYDPADAEFWEDVRKTHAEINGKKYKPTKNLKKWYEGLHIDSAEYKMWGNGIALPCAEHVLHGIAEQGAKTLGSLFDGSGGFPLAGVLNGIKPIWASEIEPYCIAVTKSRFG